MLYALYCKDADNSSEKRRSARPAHLKHLEELNAQQRLLLAGPLLADDSDDPILGFEGSLIVAEFENIAQAKAWIASDPYVTAGVFSSVNIHPFKKVFP